MCPSLDGYNLFFMHYMLKAGNGHNVLCFYKQRVEIKHPKSMCQIYKNLVRRLHTRSN